MIVRSLEVEEERKLVLPGGATIEFVYCPPGLFSMGRKGAFDGFGEIEREHKVLLRKGFWMGKYPITQAQWESVMKTNPSYFKNPDSPVSDVSWFDCMDFISRVNQSSGFCIALPTEAQWEYACRASRGTSFGRNLAEEAWCLENSGRRTHTIGRKAANDWGLYDMLGNVWEWCSDWFGSYTCDESCDPMGPNAGECRVSRGGSCYDESSYCSATHRNRGLPSESGHNVGFRVICFSGNAIAYNGVECFSGCPTGARIIGTISGGGECSSPFERGKLRETCREEILRKGGNAIVDAQIDIYGERDFRSGYSPWFAPSRYCNYRGTIALLDPMMEYQNSGVEIENCEWYSCLKRL